MEMKLSKINSKRILTTHAGSLPRSRSLVELYSDKTLGKEIDTLILSAEITAATSSVVNKQAEVGIDIPSNGEQSREAFFLYVQNRMTGFGKTWSRPAGSELLNYPEFKMAREKVLNKKIAVSNFKPPMAIGEVNYGDTKANEDEINLFLKTLKFHGTKFTDAFITAPSPGIIVRAMKNRFYPNQDEYLSAVAEALTYEYKSAVAAGLILQIDAPDLALERHISFHDRPLSEFLKFVDSVINLINKSIAGLPKERIRLHVCFGNYESPHDQDVPLEIILPHLFEANVGGFLFPFANPRHQHELKLFKKYKLKPEQYLIVGAIETLSAFVEHPEVIADRLELAANFVGDPRRIMAGTDCGFDTSAGMGRLTSDIVWAKLRSLADGAKLASARLL